MRYQRKSAIAYLFRNFWRLAPISLIAALMLGFSFNSTPEISFVTGYLQGTVHSDNILTEVLNYVSVLRFGKYWWCALIALLLFVMTESMLSVKISGHMRVGEMEILPLKKSLAVFPTMLLFVVCLAVFIELLRLMVAGVAFLLRATGEIGVIVTSVVLLFLVRVVTMWLVGALLFAFPIMFLENYGFNQALSYSVRLMSEKRKLLFLVAFLFPLSQAALTVICGFIGIFWVTVVLFGVFYLFCIIFLPCLAFKLYYDTVGGERRDITRKIF